MGNPGPMDASPKPLQRCPVCEYDLSTLPKTHRCPECGFEYDESMRVWVFPQARWLPRLIIVIFFAMLAFPSFDQLVLGGVVRAPSDGPWAFLRAVFSIGVLIAVAVYLWSRTGIQTRLVAAHRGLLIVGSSRKRQWHDWSDIWIPNPEARAGIPPWIREHNDEHNETLSETNLVWRFLRRERGGKAERFSVYLRPKSSRKLTWTPEQRLGELISLRQVPRGPRLRVMTELHDRWTMETRIEC